MSDAKTRQALNKIVALRKAAGMMLEEVDKIINELDTPSTTPLVKRRTNRKEERILEIDAMYNRRKKKSA